MISESAETMSPQETKPCHNILSASGYFHRLKEVKETDSTFQRI
jgi:hypothetical protein